LLQVLFNGVKSRFEVTQFVFKFTTAVVRKVWRANGLRRTGTNKLSVQFWNAARCDVRLWTVREIFFSKVLE